MTAARNRGGLCRARGAAIFMALAFATSGHAQPGEGAGAFLEFIRGEAARLRAADVAPASLDEWAVRREQLRARLLQAWGGFPETPCPLEPRMVGGFKRDGYRVENIIFQTRPGVWMTANAYVPDIGGKLPAVLVVHGHWPGAKQDPVVQSRCIGLAKLGFFVLAVDAFGAGERGVGLPLGEYHGDMTAATLLPVGLPLCGLQVYENMRAVDYMLTRPEVDREAIGITGASGGGNQTMYAGAWDERFRAVVPVCSVGNYQAYLGRACCLCEVVPGALQFTEEGDVLALSAPRALMVINATMDEIQFSVREARKSVARAQVVYELYGRPDALDHATFRSPHAYNRPMRETMYGWMTQHLKGEGDGALILEPWFEVEDPEILRCFPDNTRPEEFVTIPRFAAAEAKRRLGRIVAPADAMQWRSQRTAMADRLNATLHGSDGPPSARVAIVSDTIDGTGRSIVFRPEPKVTLAARQQPESSAAAGKTAILLDLDGADKAAEGEVAAELRGSGWAVVTLDLRATGQHSVPDDRIGRAPDHNSAEWSLWIGRPLLGQWVVDVQRLLDALQQTSGRPLKEIALVGRGPAGVVALCTAALDDRVTRVATVGSLASYITDRPYENQRLGIMAPGVLRDVGDVAQLAGLIAPRRLVVAGAVAGGGGTLDESEMKANFEFTRRIYAVEDAETAVRLLPGLNAAKIVEDLN